jgi:hypothetical protein
MKNKSIDNKIKTFTKLIKSLNKKYESELGGQTKVTLQVLVSDLESTISLQTELQKLKETMKIRKAELIAGIKKLKKGSKEIEKARKKDKKAAKAVKAEEKIKHKVLAEIPIPGNAKIKSGKSSKRSGNI